MGHQGLRLICVITVAACAVSGPAFAGGLGLFVDFGAGDGEWNFDEWDDFDFDADFKNVTFGFAMDTAPASERVFSYRLKVGLSQSTSELDYYRDEFELFGVVTDHTFGFGLLRTEPTRLWIGPALRTAIRIGDYEFADSYDASDVVMIELGVGPAFGANFNIGSTVTLGVEVGYRFTGHFGRIDDWADDYYDEYDTDVTGSSGTVYGGVTLLFRTGTDRR